ncbi:MAG: hypothetical protein DHS80DRAFT_24730 [Piptocephalis tieghemiana]|nr:MAG: hypothetical protein DHS80DRAFT_24730 [Piptocephalis tieghemiana]
MPECQCKAVGFFPISDTQSTSVSDSGRLEESLWSLVPEALRLSPSSTPEACSTPSPPPQPSSPITDDEEEEEEEEEEEALLPLPPLLSSSPGREEEEEEAEAKVEGDAKPPTLMPNATPPIRSPHLPSLPIDMGSFLGGQAASQHLFPSSSSSPSSAFGHFFSPDSQSKGPLIPSLPTDPTSQKQENSSEEGLDHPARLFPIPIPYVPPHSSSSSSSSAIMHDSFFRASPLAFALPDDALTEGKEEKKDE